MFLGQLFAADEPVQTASASSEASLKSHSAQEKKTSSLLRKLSAASPTSLVEVKMRLASVRNELATANDTIGMLCAEVKTSRDKMGYNRRRASVVPVPSMTV